MFAFGAATLAIVLGNWSGTKLWPKQPRATTDEECALVRKNGIEKQILVFFNQEFDMLALMAQVCHVTSQLWATTTWTSESRSCYCHTPEGCQIGCSGQAPPSTVP